MQFTALALPTVYTRMKDNPIGLAALQPGAPQRREFYLIPKILTTAKSRTGRSGKITVLLLEAFEFPADSTDITFMAKPTYELCFTYKISIFIIHTADCILNTRAGVSLVRS